MATLPPKRTKFDQPIQVQCYWCRWSAAHQVHRALTDPELIEIVRFLRQQLLKHCQEQHAEKVQLFEGE